MMKQTIYFCLLVAIGMTSDVRAQSHIQGPQIQFNKEVHDYGNITQGDNGVIEFEVTNSGDAPLIISKAVGSCSCTVPGYPKEPIYPGQRGILKVKYDTKRIGAINKRVTITSNAINAPTKVIRIQGYVKGLGSNGVPVNSSGPAAL
jgi:hypothetical protein